MTFMRMDYLLTATLVISLYSSTVYAEESQTKSGWLKSLGKKMLEEKPREETPSPVIGTRGLTDQETSSTSSEISSTETEAQSCTKGKSACLDVQVSTPPSKKKR